MTSNTPKRNKTTSQNQYSIKDDGYRVYDFRMNENQTINVTLPTDCQNFTVRNMDKDVLLIITEERQKTNPLPSVKELEEFKQRCFPGLQRSYEAALSCAGIDLCYDWLKREMWK